MSGMTVTRPVMPTSNDEWLMWKTCSCAATIVSWLPTFDTM